MVKKDVFSDTLDYSAILDKTKELFPCNRYRCNLDIYADDLKSDHVLDRILDLVLHLLADLWDLIAIRDIHSQTYCNFVFLFCDDLYTLG